MVMVLYLKHGDSEDLIEDLLEFVNVIAGKPVLPGSKKTFNNIFGVESTEIHLFCSKCNVYLGAEEGNKEWVCSGCNETISANKYTGENFFVTLDFKKQVKDLTKKYIDEITAYRKKLDDFPYFRIHLAAVEGREELRKSYASKAG